MSIQKSIGVIGIFGLIISSYFNIAHAAGASLIFTPNSGSIIAESLFDVSVILDSGEQSVNVVDIKIEFPADKLQVVSPSTGDSFVSLWLRQSSYSNTAGTITFTGSIPEGGIKTSKGLVSTITFRAKAPGVATLKVADSSNVLAADGQGTKILATYGRAVFAIAPKAPEGPKVFSTTHSDSNQWYNNNNATFAWDGEPEVTAYSKIKLRSDLKKFVWPDYWQPRKPIVKILAFILMKNHFHFILEEVVENGIAKFMQRLGTGMTMYYNNKYQETGRLFQGAYNAKLIDKDMYLKYLNVYVQVKNGFELFNGGFEAAMKDFDKAYKWITEFPYGSLSHYYGKVAASIVDKDLFLEIFASSDDYKNFAKECMLDLENQLGELIFD